MTDKKTFVRYVAETKTEYKYVLKFAVDSIDDKLDGLEECLKKYELISASPFKRTPIQSNPLDFPNVKNTSVFICNISMGYPASLDFLKTYICNSLHISPEFLAVYSENDPRQIETDLYVDRNSEEYKKNYKARLGSDYEATEKPAYGAEYNISFLQELEKVSKERKITTVDNPLSPAAKTDAVGKDYDSFNDPKNLKSDDTGFFGRVKKTKLSKAGVLQ
jgi:hypothetical protein